MADFRKVHSCRNSIPHPNPYAPCKVPSKQQQPFLAPIDQFNIGISDNFTISYLLERSISIYGDYSPWQFPILIRLNNNNVIYNNQY